MTAKNTGLTSVSWNSRTSKQLWVPVDRLRQRYESLNTVAKPPPRPGNREELKKIQPWGTSSVNGLKSPGSVMPRACRVKTSFNINILFTRERGLIKATWNGDTSPWGCVEIWISRRLEVFTPPRRTCGRRQRRETGTTGQSHRYDESSEHQWRHSPRIIPGPVDSKSAEDLSPSATPARLPPFLQRHAKSATCRYWCEGN